MSEIKRIDEIRILGATDAVTATKNGAISPMADHYARIYAQGENPNQMIREFAARLRMNGLLEAGNVAEKVLQDWGGENI